MEECEGITWQTRKPAGERVRGSRKNVQVGRCSMSWKKKNQTNDEDMVMVTAAIYSHGSVNCNNAASFGRCNDIIYVNCTENWTFRKFLQSNDFKLKFNLIFSSNVYQSISHATLELRMFKFNLIRWIILSEIAVNVASEERNFYCQPFINQIFSLIFGE